MAAAIGFSFSFHYCGGEYHSICFTGDAEKDCCGEMEKGNEGCCEDKIVSAKYKDDHTPSAVTIVISSIISILPPRAGYHIFTSEIFSTSVVPNYNKGPAPPLITGIPLYLLLRVLRI